MQTLLRSRLFLQSRPLSLLLLLLACLPLAVRAESAAEPSPYRLRVLQPIASTPPTPAIPSGTPYQKLVHKAAQKYKLEAALLHAVIAIESNHSATAVSPMGALGLMQVLPDTGKRYGATDLFNPQQNIAAGAAYLRMLLDRYDQDLDLALAAYNAGEGAVDRHGRKIPKYRETQRYVPAVKARYELWSGRSAIKTAAEPSPYRLTPDALEKVTVEY